MKKVYENAEAALFDVKDGASLMSGGFGLCGNAENSIRELARKGVKDLTVVSNNCGNAGKGLAMLLKNRQVKTVIASFIGGNPDLQQQMLAGEVEVQLNPQGTLAERIRAGGAGIGGFFTPTGVGTVVAEGKEERVIDGKRYIFEKPLTADFAIIRARYGDAYGNLRFYRTARNFSPLMAMAARVTVAEVDELVPVGALDPDDIHLPGIFVQRIYRGTDYENPIENRTVRPRA
ncbi:CoA transferase subunit A [Myxococcota bacterium]|nr:CoA transferase subunit A [Myxococcota bacterium]